MNVTRALAGIGALGMLLAPPAWAAGAPDPGEGNATPLEQAREESAVKDPPRTRHDLPAGVLRLSRSELLAGSGQQLELAVALERGVADGVLELTLPALWVQRSAVSGLRFARVPQAGRLAGAGAQATRSGRVVRFAFRGAEAGAAATFAIADVGIPAGRYELPYRWRESGAGARAGVARVHIHAPVREAGEGEPDGDWRLLAREASASDSPVDESEAFVTVVPGNRLRYVVGANVPPYEGLWGWITNSGGPPFTKAEVSETLDAPGEAGPEQGKLCCDPMSAADGAGNLWYGGRADNNGGGRPSRIVVSRAAPGATAFGPTSVGLHTRTGSEQDKPMMTIDNFAGSPTFGRLYVAWSERDVGIRIVLSYCDTRTAGLLDAARCDDADNWTVPVSVTPSAGSYISADVAVGPDGKAHVVWWDTSAANAIRGDACDPLAHDCSTPAAWVAPVTIATLDATGGLPVPGRCPIPAQPGGRASPSPQVEVDRSGGPQHNRVYVTWSDLRAASGVTRCANAPPIAGDRMTWDSFVASAPGALPGAPPGDPQASAVVGTPLLTDGEGAGQPNSDDWLPWLTVDQSTGLAWAAFYSTRDDPTRRTTHFYVRAVAPDGAGHARGVLRRVSTAPSDYSANPCCEFGDDQGDYSGIDATQGHAIASWAARIGTGTGEAYVDVVPAAAFAPDAAVIDESPAAGGDGDGALEPGESFRLTATLRNTGAATAHAVSATLSAPAGSGVTLGQASSPYPDIAAGDAASNTTAFAGALAAGVPCGTPIALTLRAATTTTPEPALLAIALPTGCPPVVTPAVVPRAATDTNIVFALTGRGTQKPPTARRGIAVRLSCPFENCRVTLTARLTIPATARGGEARRLKLRTARVRVTRATRRTYAFKPSLAQRRRIARALRTRRTRLGVRVVVTATARDAAGNARKRTKTIRVRR
jgi:hypothetical protein